MTLQEKFEQAPEVYNANFEIVKGYEKIADEFAIEFASWFICYYTEEAFYDKNYIKEMLEKYKKENGL
jgi:hypothetical protein